MHTIKGRNAAFDTAVSGEKGLTNWVMHKQLISFCPVCCKEKHHSQQMKEKHRKTKEHRAQDPAAE